VYRIKKLKSGQGPKGCTVIERVREREMVLMPITVAALSKA
jgi:hypothetical protein